VITLAAVALVLRAAPGVTRRFLNRRCLAAWGGGLAGNRIAADGAQVVTSTG
jgi:hypothetical protein